MSGWISVTDYSYGVQIHVSVDHIQAVYPQEMEDGGTSTVIDMITGSLEVRQEPEKVMMAIRAARRA